MSDTPRTDAYVLKGGQRSRQDMIEFAKKLERELIVVDTQLDSSKNMLIERDAEIERLRGALTELVTVAHLPIDDEHIARHNAAWGKARRLARLAQPKEPT